MTGNCVDLCNDNVKCPVGQKCESPDGCVPLCQGVTCKDGENCDPKTGKCDAGSCTALTCFPPQMCKNGVCVDGAGGGGAGGGNASGGGSAGGPFGSGGNDDSGNTGGCCGVAGEAPDGRGAASFAMLVLGLFMIAGRRRRRR